MVHARSGRGKSMFCMGLAIALAGGVPFLGWEVPRPRRVIYVDAELDPADLQERISDMLEASGMANEHKGVAMDNLKIVSQQYLEVKPEKQLPDLTDEKAVEVLSEWCKAFQADLLILDNLTSLADVYDENAASSFAFVDAIGRRLKAEGVAVMLVHHNRKGAEGGDAARGSSSLIRPLDAQWELGAAPETKDSLLVFSVHNRKIRIKPGRDVRAFSAVLEDGDEGLCWRVSEARGDEISPELQDIVDIIQSRQYHLDKDMAEALGIPKDKFSRRRKRVIELGLITKEEADECKAEAKRLYSEALEDADADF